MGFWSDFKEGIGVGSEGGEDVPIIGTAGRMIGLYGTKSDDLAEDAAAAMAASNKNAQGAYDLALQQAAASGLINAPSMISATNVAAPTITAGVADQYGIVNTSDPLVQAYNAQAQRYEAAKASAVSANPDMVGYDATLAKARNAAGDMVSYTPSEARAYLAGPAALASVDRVDTTVSAPKAISADLANAAGVARTDVSSLATDTRGETLDAARAIMDARSSADKQFASSFDKATDDALAVANRARGDERAGARREAMIQMALKGAAGAEGAAGTAAQEDAAKRVAYAQALQGVRGADVSVAQTQAQIDAQRAQLQANLETAVAQGNVAASNSIKQQMIGLEADTAKATVQAGLQQQSTEATLAGQNAREQNAIALANAQLGSNTELANAAARSKANSDLAANKNLAAQQYAAADTGVSAANAAAATKAASDLAASKNLAAQQFATAQTGVSQTNAAATTQAASDYAKAQNEMGAQYAAAATKASESNATLDAQRAEGNAARAASVATSDAQNKTSAGIAQGQATLAAGQSNATNSLDADKTNTNAYLDTERLKQTGTASGIQGMNTAASVQGGNAGAVVNAQAKEAEAQAKQDAALVGGVTSLGGILSDRRTKTDIRQPSDSAIDDLADKTRAYTWRYKPEYADEYGYGTRGGVMAQDVERSKLGRQFVHEGPDGTKEVDVLSLAGLLAAAAARSIRKNKESRRTT